ncbi:MAG: hypothetical protein VKM34_11540 [Cyanobacteriota bacterium]|nr:hypothetical protein [Cyanobacteriota bacterium]
MKMLLMGPAHSPGLELMHRISGWIEIVVTGDLRQFGAVAQTIALVRAGPGQKFAGWAQLPGSIGREGDPDNDGMILVHGGPPGPRYAPDGDAPSAWTDSCSSCYQLSQRDTALHRQVRRGILTATPALEIG